MTPEEARELRPGMRVVVKEWVNGWQILVGTIIGRYHSSEYPGEKFWDVKTGSPILTAYSERRNIIGILNHDFEE